MGVCSGLSVRGRCRTQTLSFASIAMLEASPSFHCDGTFGHARSTSKIGRARPCGSAACAKSNALEIRFSSTVPTRANVTRTAQPLRLHFTAFSSLLASFLDPHKLCRRNELTQKSVQLRQLFKLPVAVAEFLGRNPQLVQQ